MTWVCFQRGVDLFAALASLLTAAIAVWVWLRFVWSAHARRVAIEKYLRDEREQDGDKGMRSVLHLMSNLSMTEEQVFSAAFSSKCVSAVPLTDEKSGFAKAILFVYLPPKKGRFWSK